MTSKRLMTSGLQIVWAFDGSFNTMTMPRLLAGRPGTRVRFSAETTDFSHNLLAGIGSGALQAFSLAAAEGPPSRGKAAKRENG
jgi:hypothetical protein